MGICQSIGAASDRVVTGLVLGLEQQFGRGAGEALAHRFLDAEETDFLWDARDQERWLGSYDCLDTDGMELDRIAILGSLDGRWFMGILLVDGDGMAHGTLGRRWFRNRGTARKALLDAH